MPENKVVHVKDYIAAVIWAHRELGSIGERWQWTLLETNNIEGYPEGKFTFEDEKDAIRFKLVWG